ncbi:MAG: hypothetical protein ACXVCH_05730 [Bdellovibrionota bacterium]
MINYWEIRPSKMGSHLDRLLRQGVTSIATFIPWQAVESDISHTLTKFLQAASERKMTVSLILTPEVGVHFPNSGLPKDVISRKDNRAISPENGPIAVHLPPNSFSVPSLFAPEFTKRYYSFLSRIDNLLADLAKNNPGVLSHVTTVLTGSFWKYYRSPLVASRGAFSGSAGDYASGASVAYRQRLEHYLSQREFMDPTPASANRWKTRAYEEINRRWFYQQSEDVFRNRSFQAIRKKATSARIREIELYTPEADPALVYSNFLQMVAGGHGDFPALSSLVDHAAARSSMASASSAPSYIHWTAMGGFRTLSDSEKQFLILKSLLLVGSQGGGVLIDESEWFALSTSFRVRAEALARSIAHGDLQLKSRVTYLSPHLWSSCGVLWDELLKRAGPAVRMVASLDLVSRERDSHLLFVDPSMILTREVIQKLSGWTKAGRVVVLPRSSLYTESARRELELLTANSARIEIDLGIPYQVHALGDGKMIIYDLPESTATDATIGAWQAFVAAVLSVADIENYCRLSDGRLAVIPLQKRGEGLAAFVLNGTRRQVTADILFSTKVQVSDLAVALTAAPASVLDQGSLPAPSTRFSLEVPPFGILPLAVDGISVHEHREKHAAALTADATRDNALAAAASELPGFSAEGGVEEVWS